MDAMRIDSMKRAVVRVLQCVAEYSSVLQCVAVWCSVVQCGAGR